MNYLELITSAKAYSDRQDLETKAFIDVFIIMTEAKINRLLKTREQSVRVYSPTVTDQEYYPIPPDYAGMRDVQLNSDLPTVSHSTVSFEYLTPVLFNRQRTSPFGGVHYYTIISNQIQIYPCQDIGKYIEMIYFQKVPALTETDDENWLSLSHPDIYLSGVVAEIELFSKNYEVGKGWLSRMTLAIDELDNSDEIERWSGTPLYTKTDA